MCCDQKYIIPNLLDYQNIFQTFMIFKYIPYLYFTQDGRAPIRYAAANEDEELTKLLLINGANPDITTLVNSESIPSFYY